MTYTIEALPLPAIEALLPPASAMEPCRLLELNGKEEEETWRGGHRLFPRPPVA